MARSAGDPILDSIHVDRPHVDRPGASRTRDQLFCLELASQAADVYFDRTWEQIEPILESTWENGTHEMSWCEARWFVKCAWTDCLNRGAAGHADVLDARTATL
ncbi:hypothetical protein [Cognatiluteimonas lumbrici]|uniref:hypothetical protein n=1 Tax=Cognatiluteimonas lumbrici TaxID=2559601 RepID=UPI001129638B|nr:hypothetical protein [Luteimonas lumbrici]